MQEIRGGRTIFGGAALLLYLLMIFFSHQLHDHGSGAFFKEFGLRDHSKTLRTSGGISDDAGCLSCHVLYDGHSPFLDFSLFDFRSSLLFQEEILAYRQRFSTLSPQAFHLRGPPAA